MNKLKLVLLTSDDSYADYFSNFMLNPDNNNRFSTKIFTNKDSFNQMMRNQKQHILLTDYNLEDIDVSVFEKTIILRDKDEYIPEEVPNILKYQPIKNLLDKVLAIFYEENGNLQLLSNEGDSGSYVISFYGGSSGVGKTLSSLCLARHLSIKDKRVFYLNLETVHTTLLYFKEEKESSAEVFYYVKNNKDKLLSKIEFLKSRDDLTGIDYFSLPVNPEEMDIFTGEDLEVLIQALKATKDYDFIIIDLDSTLHERNTRALEISDEVFWLLSSDEASFSRSKYILESNTACENLDRAKIHFVINKMGTDVFNGFDRFNFSIEDRLPFNERFLLQSEETKLHEDTVIGERLFRLMKSLVKEDTEVSSVGN